MLIDTHCHLDAGVFATDLNSIMQNAFSVGVQAIVVPAVDVGNFSKVKELAQKDSRVFYALGIHPMYVDSSSEADLDILHDYLAANIDDPQLVAIGEIGLDFYLPELKNQASMAKQEKFYVKQLGFAKEFNLPVLLHVRKSHDILLKHLRRNSDINGIAHAFNGSFQQAQQFLDLGFKLGVGGAMTFARARQIRRLITQLPMSAFVLETDAPDMAPEWLVAKYGKQQARNEPAQVKNIAAKFAELRVMSDSELINICAGNAFEVLPRLNKAMTKQSQN